MRKHRRPRLGTEGAALDRTGDLDLTVTPPAATPPHEPSTLDDVLRSLAELPAVLARLSDALDRPPVEHLLTRKDLCRILRISTAVFDRLRAGGRLPRPDLVLSRRSPRWRAATVCEWLAQQADGRGRARP
jgi:predicted DNA-binding transcriptional regulator AlpA